MSVRSVLSHTPHPHLTVRRRVTGEPTRHEWIRELLLVLAGLLVYFGVRAATDDGAGIVRIGGALMPVAMGLAVVVTANHYVIDVIVGGIVALSGLGTATLLIHARERRAEQSSAESFGSGTTWSTHRC